MEPAVGIEPTTHGLQNRCSTAELSRRDQMIALKPYPILCSSQGEILNFEKVSEACLIKLRSLEKVG